MNGSLHTEEWCSQHDLWDEEMPWRVNVCDSTGMKDWQAALISRDCSIGMSHDIGVNESHPWLEYMCSSHSIKEFHICLCSENPEFFV